MENEVSDLRHLFTRAGGSGGGGGSSSESRSHLVSLLTRQVSLSKFLEPESPRDWFANV